MATAQGEKLLSTREVAERLQVHHGTVYAYIKQGVPRLGGRIRLRAVKLGRYRVPESALQEFLKALGATAPVDFTGEEARRERERRECSERMRKRLGIEEGA